MAAEGTSKTPVKAARTAAKRGAAKPAKPRKAVAAARSSVLSRPARPGRSTCAISTIHEDDALDETQIAAWVKQAAALPGEKM